MAKSHTYSEIFYSPQGEGSRTGRPSLWIRWFGCNLSCDGFGQKDPTDPETYVYPYKDLAEEIKSGKRPEIKAVEDMPVFCQGCDSSYSWAAGFKNLQKAGTAEEISHRLEDLLRERFPASDGLFSPPQFRQTEIDLCITGGEPLLKRNQLATVDLLNAFRETYNVPRHVTFETNGTQFITPELLNVLEDVGDSHGTDVLFSYSPKLFTVSGEPVEKAQRIDVIRENFYLVNMTRLKQKIQLKFVMSTEQRAWDELDAFLDKMTEAQTKSLGEIPLDGNVWIMPVGATAEAQDDISGQVADMAIERGFNVSARVHCALYGNQIGK